MQLTWATLVSTPEYLLAFLEGFLTVFLPTAGFGQAATSDGGGVVQALTQTPSHVVIGAAFGFGLLGGIRAIRNLRTPPPAIEAKP